MEKIAVEKANIQLVPLDPGDNLIKDLKLPAQIAYSYKSYDFFSWKKNTEEEDLKKVIEMVEAYFDKNIKQWDDNSNNYIQFGLPATIFGGGRPPINL